MNERRAITCVIVDDNLIDRLTVQAFIQKCPSLKLLESFESSTDALDKIPKLNPDVVFLDVDMPEITGLQLREQLLNIPACVFISSYPEYAIDGFDLDAVDFLAKPFNAQRFSKMANRLQEYFEIIDKAELLSHTIGADTVFIKHGTQQIKLQLHEIIYLEAMKDYTAIVTPIKKYMVLESIGNLIKEKTFLNFIRIHRSYAVQKHFIKQYDSKEVVLNNSVILPLGRSFKDVLKTLL